MTERRPFTEDVARSLAVLEEDVPAFARGLAERLGQRRVAITVDDEALTVGVTDGRAAVGPPTSAVHVRLTTSRRAILRLANGERLLHDAILAGDVDLVGELDDLLAFDAALMMYLHGAVRSRRFPTLLHAFRLGVDP